MWTVRVRAKGAIICHSLLGTENHRIAANLTEEVIICQLRGYIIPGFGKNRNLEVT